MTVTQNGTAAAPVAATVARLRAAFAAGTTRPLAWRRGQLAALDRLIGENMSELTAALHADLGKSGAEAWIGEFGLTLGEIANAQRQLRRWTAPERVRQPLAAWPGSSAIVREPYGVALVISPWNYPLSLCLTPLTGALAAGNCVLIKPSEIAPHTSAALARLVPRYLDRACVAVVEGGVETAQALLEQHFDYIFFTGSTAVGRIVAEAAAKQLTPVTLELGGKSPAIVAADANLDLAARQIAFGKFLNAGQTCIAPDYVLVDRARYEELLAALAVTIRSFYGSNPKLSGDYGRIIDERHFDRLERLLEGATIAFGGARDRAARYFGPTVLREVAPDAAVMADEIFGPILPVIAVDGIAEALAFVNARPKPLALYVFSSDRALADRVIDGTAAGGSAVNCTLLQYANQRLPFGGVGASGMGAYHGRFGFETFSHRRAVLRKAGWLDLDVAYPPFTPAKLAILKRIFR
jgi:aldehyde dehydrogenase (NAD+)